MLIAYDILNDEYLLEIEKLSISLNDQIKDKELVNAKLLSNIEILNDE